MQPDRWAGLRLILLTIAVLVGGILLLGGIVETWVAVRHPEQDASLRSGLLFVVAGLLLAGLPMAYAYVDMVRDILRRGRSKSPRRRGGRGDEK